MANKAEYLQNLGAATGVLAVGQAVKIDNDSAGIALYEVIVVEVNTTQDAALRKTVRFYVQNDNIAGEKCFDYKTVFESELSPADRFVALMQTWVYAQGHAEMMDVLSVDNTRKRARVMLYKQQNENFFLHQEAMIWKTSGTWYIRRLQS